VTGWRAWVTLLPECEDCTTPFAHRYASRWSAPPVPQQHPDRRHCEWCAIELARWRVALGKRHCAVCSPKIHGDAGIYCQTGGPPCSMGARRGQTERKARR
jgi:hypothetical protein